MQTMMILLLALDIAGLLLLAAIAVLIFRRGKEPWIEKIVSGLASFEGQQARFDATLRSELSASRGESAEGARSAREELGARMGDFQRSVEDRLTTIEKENSAKLDEIRQTVDEKLHTALEKRLGDAFQRVSERLEQVHQGLGEMHELAAGMGDLKKVLSNVKTRGVWGEMWIGKLLEQALTPAQYVKNFRPRPESAESVEYAIRLPGKGNAPVWIPIDAKFSQEDYLRLVDAQERGDLPMIEEASRSLEARVKSQAKDIRDKYINPPMTTDFAVLFLPVESLYAEVLRRPGLCESLQSEYRVVLAGPTTFMAFLNSLQMGFRTVAIEQRASEVWQLLSAVKTIEDATKKTRTIERRLREVEELPGTPAREALDQEDSRKEEEAQA
jgi:DNA recombination protein RmuC